MGDKISSSLATFFVDEKNLSTLDSMIGLGLDIKNPDFAAGANQELPLTGLSFVITGTLQKPRKEVEDLIRKKRRAYVLSTFRKNEFPYCRRGARLKTQEGKDPRSQNNILS